MGKQNTKVNIPMCAALVLLLLTMISVHLTSGLYARYTSTASGSDSARVAKFHVVSDQPQDVQVNCWESNEGVYTIKVENQSEVAIEYVLNITFVKNVNATDLTVTMKDDGKEVDCGFQQNMKFTRDTPLAPGSSRTHEFTFEVYDWRTVTVKSPDDNAGSYDWELDFTVTINVEQVD